MAPIILKSDWYFFCKYLNVRNLPRMDSNHDKVIQSHHFPRGSSFGHYRTKSATILLKYLINGI